MKLSKNNILQMQCQIVEKFGGNESGLRSPDSFDLSVNAPFQTFAGQELHSTIIEKAACLCYNLIKNHSFIDGNKRIGIHSMLVYLKLNNIDLTYTQQELIDLVIDIASSKITQSDLINWIIKHQ